MNDDVYRSQVGKLYNIHLYNFMISKTQATTTPRCLGYFTINTPVKLHSNE